MPGTTIRAIGAGLMLALSLSASAADAVRPFVAGSLASIAAERQGRPFILAFWSVGCTHCPAELKTLGKLKQANPQLEVVLVAADTPEDAPQTAELASRYGLGKAEQWVFSDAMPERLRFEIDPRWRGELPRTHFFDREHRVDAVSGVVAEAQLADWVKRNRRQ